MSVINHQLNMNLDLPILGEQAPSVAEQSLGRKIYVETYGCQMNLSDSEIVSGVMHKHGYEVTDVPDNADVILINTCAIRDNAEKKIHDRLKHIRHYKKKNHDLVVGILGCMAERLRDNLLSEQGLVDLVVGPDEYRRVPELIENALAGSQGIAVKLSRVETYDDVIPLRTEGISAWVSIMRGCDKFCTFCVVPFTRGRERSRAMNGIVDELKQLDEQGFKEVTLLGQNVNSYLDEESNSDFADLLDACARAVPTMRIRYTTSHPYDMSDKLIATMAAHKNICKYIHLPVQSGSDRILQLMNRNYTAAHYLERIRAIRKAMPDCALTTDIIVGFCTETEEDHQLTMQLMREVRYEGAFMYNYSARENTKAWKMGDDVPEDVKTRRLTEIIEQQRRIADAVNRTEIGNTLEVLVEGPSKKSGSEWRGRSDSNKIVIFPHNEQADYIVGDLIHVRIESGNAAALVGRVVQMEPSVSA